MSGAVFFLVVNFIVALSFSSMFIVVAYRSQSRDAALWLGTGFAIASLSALCELLVAYAGPTRLWALGAFATVLCGMVMLTIGVGHMYRRRIDLRLAMVFVFASLGLAHLIYDLPRGTPLQAFLYQSPFAAVVLVAALLVFVAHRRTGLDLFLGFLLLVTGIHFLGKAGLAVLVGSGATPKDYVHTNYALISQSLTAILMVAVGLSLLAKLVLEIVAIHRTESEIDILSSLANRRGFDRQVQAILTRNRQASQAIIICDLDHFKRINDTYGHHVGDAVIRAFGDCLRQHAPIGSVTGRIGGEEFAIFLSDASMEDARELALKLRHSTMFLSNLPRGLRVTASFGVAPVSAETELAEAYRQADLALYLAKNAGRNRVKLASATVESLA
ncbi:MAG: GGDEF domain-containing protein [Alphaproteobacteria bacterium]|nr:GGDEF domain-containing protein [Alphaproteobacteria bacterium]